MSYIQLTVVCTECVPRGPFLYTPTHRSFVNLPLEAATDTAAVVVVDSILQSTSLFWVLRATVGRGTGIVCTHATRDMCSPRHPAKSNTVLSGKPLPLSGPAPLVRRHATAVGAPAREDSRARLEHRSCRWPVLRDRARALAQESAR